MINRIPQIKHTKSGNFFLMAGPCVIESEEIALRIAEKIVNITDKLEIPLIFKGSYRKAKDLLCWEPNVDLEKLIKKVASEIQL